MNYTQLASKESVQKTMKALQEHGIESFFVEQGTDALRKIKELIPHGASVMNGASRTLEQIGFVEYLKSDTHGWNNLHKTVFAEKDPIKQSLLRKHASISDYYLGSVHAVSETGEFLIASNTGSQLPSIVFNAANLIFVVSTQKIVPSLSEAFNRLEKQVIPLEDERMKQAYGVGTMLSKVLIFKRENQMMGRKVNMIFVNEKLGF